MMLLRRLLLRLLWLLLALVLVTAPDAYRALLQQNEVVPSARKQAAAVTANGTGWLFGGESGGESRNDLWQYTTGGSGGWSHLGGEGSGQRGVYSNLGGAAFVDSAASPASTPPWPGSRVGATLFSAGDGRLCLFGGHGTGASGRTGYLNDLWIFLGVQNSWVWWGGSDEVDQPSCTQGTECQQHCPLTVDADSLALVGCSWPGGRRSASFWHDRSVRSSGTTARVSNANYEADELPDVGFLYASPTGWNASGTVVVVRNGIYRWGIAQSGHTGQFVALLSAPGTNSSILQRVEGLTPGKDYLVSWRAASGFAEGEWLYVFVNDHAVWSGQPPDQFATKPETLVFTAPADSFVDLKFVGWHPDFSGGDESSLIAIFLDDIELTRAHKDTVYIFGGVGCDTLSCHAFHSLNDLWWYTDDAFHFVQGSVSANEVGRYPGTSTNLHQPIWPGSRSFASGWYDPVANTGVIFGGKGCDAVECASYSYLNDLWTFDSVYLAGQLQTSQSNASILHIEFLGGSRIRNSDGNFPNEIGHEDVLWPGARESSATWVDSDGNAYIFGGSGFDEVGMAVSALSDLWQWNTVEQTWRWLGGPSTGNEVNLGTELTWPGARAQAAVWYDLDSEVVWMFGGKKARSTALVDELWQFVPDEYAVCSTMSLDAITNLPAFADVSRCELSSSQRTCVVDSCSTNFVASGTGQVVCVVQAATASLEFESADSFSCIQCVEQPAVAVSCTASTEYAESYSCEKVYDGNFRRDAGEWSTAGEGGGWVRIEYDGTYRIDRMDFQQRWREMDWATSISIDFSDGSSQSLDLVQSAEIQSYWLEPVFTRSASLSFTGVRASYSNVGATEIREFLSPYSDTSCHLPQVLTCHVRVLYRGFCVGFMGCRDFCPDVNVGTAIGLPPHVDTSRCHLNKFAPSCKLDSCEDGFIMSASSANGSGFVHCTSQQDAAHVVYEAGPIPLLCMPAPVAVTASPSDSVLLTQSTEVVAGEQFVYTVELRINATHPAVGTSSSTPLAVTSSIPPCKDVFGDLWTYLETRNRVSACPLSSIAFQRHADESHLVQVSLQAVTQPGRYWIRTFQQNREESPHFELALMISASQLNIIVVPASPSPRETTFSLQTTIVEFGELVHVALMPRDAFGNPTTIENRTTWRPFQSIMDDSRPSGSAASVYLDGNNTRCSARPTTTEDSEFVLMVHSSARSGDLLHVTLGGADILGSPATLQIVPTTCIAGCGNQTDPCESLSRGANWLLCDGNCIPALLCDIPRPCDAVDGFTSCTTKADYYQFQPICYPDVDECASAPCHNGDCVQGYFSFRCECFPGFEGDACEIDIDECASNPCENSGTCTDSSTGTVSLVSTACVPRAVCVQDDPCAQSLGTGWVLCASGACVLVSSWCGPDPCEQVLGSMYGRTCSRWGLTEMITDVRGRRRTLQSPTEDFTNGLNRQQNRRSVVTAGFKSTRTQDVASNFISSTSSNRGALGYSISRPQQVLRNPYTSSAARRVQELHESAVSGCVVETACIPDPCGSLGAAFTQCEDSCAVRTLCDTCTQDDFTSECTLRTHQCASTPVPLSVPLLHRLAAAHITSPTTTDWGGISGYWQCCEVIEQFSIEECINDSTEPPSSKAFTITTHLSCNGTTEDHGCIAVIDAPYIWSHQPHWPIYVQSNSFTFAFDAEICRSEDVESPCDNIGMVPCGDYCVPRHEGSWEVRSMTEQGLYSTTKKHCDPRGSIVADFAMCERAQCDCQHVHGGNSTFDECCVCGGDGTSCHSDPQPAESIQNYTETYDQDYYYYDFSSGSGSGSWADTDQGAYSGSYSEADSWIDADSESGSWSSDQSLDYGGVQREQCVPLSAGACTELPGDPCRALGSFVACRLASSMVVHVDISFAIDLEVIGESAAALHIFKQSVAITIAASLGIEYTRVRVISVEAGSIIVVVEITAATDGQEMTPVDAAVALQDKLADPNDSIRHESDVFATALGVVGMSVVMDGDPDDNVGGTVSLAFDCAGVVGGNATRDHCGTCDDDISTDCVVDCAGVWGGSSSLDRCGECGGDDSCVDCRGVPFGEATYDDCSTSQPGMVTSSDSGARLIGLGDRKSVAGGDASKSGDFRGLLGIFAVGVAAAMLALAVMCVLKPFWWPTGFVSKPCSTCRRWCAMLWSCLIRSPRLLACWRTRRNSKVIATTRRRAYAYGTGSSSDDENNVCEAGGQQFQSKPPPESWAGRSTIIARAGGSKQHSHRQHTPELKPSSGLPSNLDPISMDVLHKIDWIAAKARLNEV